MDRVRALVLYESMFGNTRRVAGAIAEGLNGYACVRSIRDVAACDFTAVDLVVIGGPTHEHGLSQFATRMTTERRAETNGVTLDAGASVGVGLRELFRRLRTLDGVAAAAFDTRHQAARDATGSAAEAIARRLRRGGAVLVADPTSFFVDDTDHLHRGELTRAAEFGASLAMGLDLLGLD